MTNPTDQKKTGLFRINGKNYAFVFTLICSLFLLWGVAHALLDVLNKQFQNSLQVTKAQSGCVQAAVYGGYFLMALPAGLVARRFGYKGGIILGLTLFALGAFWFVPATKSDRWNGTIGWVSSHFHVTTVPPEAKDKLADARAALLQAGRDYPELKKGETRTPEAETEGQAKAKTQLDRATADLEEVNKIVPDSKTVADARAKVADASQAIPTADFSKKRSDATLAVVDIDKATQMTAFTAFLLGLFVIALGLTCLETIANPYTTVLGPPETGASRINLAQTCNALGWILGPLIGSLAIFSGTSTVNTSNAQLAIPYVILGVIVLMVLAMFAFSTIPDIHTEEHADASQHRDKKSGERSLFSQPHFIFAVVAQFLYVAAQTGVNSFFINYMVEVNGWQERKAGLLLSSGGMVLFMIGRFSGSFLMRVMKPHLALATYGLLNVVCMGLVVAGMGVVSAGALIACYFFMSVMFPTIFALGIRGLGENTKKGASFIVMSIVGGAIAPILMGSIADKHGMQMGFIIPLVCFAAIMLYGFAWQKLFNRDMGSDAGAPVAPSH